MNQMTEPATAAVGDSIAHDLMPGFVMKVQEVRDCQRDTTYFPHSQYKITDPEGEPDWLCAYDVSRAR